MSTDLITMCYIPDGILLNSNRGFLMIIGIFR